MQKLSFSLLALVMSLSVCAQSVKTSRSYDDCVNANAPINNSIVFGCAEEASAPIRKQMNTVYMKLYNQLKTRDASLADKLELAQKTWLEHRKTQCDLEASLTGSPMEAICTLNMNEERLQQLNSWAKDALAP